MVVPPASGRDVGSLSDGGGPDLRDEGSGGTGNCQFEGIPEELNRWVLKAPEELREPFAFGNLAITAVIAFYLGRVLDRKVPFLDFPENRPDRIPWQQTVRMTQIANALFILRSEPGFREICRRLNSREDIRSAAFEAFAAQLFRERGFTVLARPETGLLGQDFDFAARIDDVEINVEATALTVPSFSEGTILSALGRKRGQLPSNKPAVIVCFVPGSWRQELGELEGVLAPVGVKFLRGTKRINHLIFVEDLMFPEGDGGAASFHIIGLRNHDVRHPCQELDDLIMSKLMNDQAYKDYTTAEAPVGLSGSSDLFKWIEWLKGRLS